MPVGQQQPNWVHPANDQLQPARNHVKLATIWFLLDLAKAKWLFQKVFHLFQMMFY